MAEEFQAFFLTEFWSWDFLGPRHGLVFWMDAVEVPFDRLCSARSEFDDSR
jgi:hypothetical protein